MGARLQVLDPAARETLHVAALELLFSAGVDVSVESARHALADFGAMVDIVGVRVRLPNSVVKEALRAAPREVVLGSRDGAHDLRLPDGRSHVTTDGAGVLVRDLETGARRPSVSADLAGLTRVADALDEVEVQWPMVVAGDVPPEHHGKAEAALVLENTGKHVQHEAFGRADAEAMVSMAAAVAGGEDALRRRPPLSAVQCPVSPLTLEAGSTEALMVFARAGIPVVPISMVLVGASSPVTLASALVMSHAENLASLVLSQAVARGAPVIWGVSSGPVDMRTGAFGAAAPEAGLLSAAGAELARHVGLPCLVAGFVADAAEPGFQAGLEKLGSGLAAILGGADLISGIGSFETDRCLSAEQLVLDADLVGYARTLAEGIDVHPEQISLDLMARRGPGADFLRERHTLEHFRDALWSPRLLDRGSPPDGPSAHERLRRRAAERAAALVRDHEPPPLDQDVRERMWALAGVPRPPGRAARRA